MPRAPRSAGVRIQCNIQKGSKSHMLCYLLEIVNPACLCSESKIGHMPPTGQRYDLPVLTRWFHWVPKVVNKWPLWSPQEIPPRSHQLSWSGWNRLGCMLLLRAGVIWKSVCWLCSSNRSGCHKSSWRSLEDAHCTDLAVIEDTNCIIHELMQSN